VSEALLDAGWGARSIINTEPVAEMFEEDPVAEWVVPKPAPPSFAARHEEETERSGARHGEAELRKRLPSAAGVTGHWVGSVIRAVQRVSPELGEALLVQSRETHVVLGQLFDLGPLYVVNNITRRNLPRTGILQRARNLVGRPVIAVPFQHAFLGHLPVDLVHDGERERPCAHSQAGCRRRPTSSASVYTEACHHWHLRACEVPTRQLAAQWQYKKKLHESLILVYLNMVLF
jgi:hypothetical protein